MPTEPLQSILDREFAIANAQELIVSISPKLQEIVNYSTNAVARCFRAASNEDRSFALPFIYLHMIEMTDGVEVLLSKSCASAAIPLVRSSFEALLSIEYILKRNTESRSLAWEADFMRKRITLYRSFNTATNEGQRLQNSLQGDRIIGSANFSYPTEFDGFITTYENQLNSPKYQPIEQEFQNVRQQINRRPNWYQLFGPPAPENTPRNIFQLAEHLERGAMYEILYREWSSIHHSTNPSRFIASVEEAGEQGVRPLRDATQMKVVSDFAANFMVNATILLLHEFRPGEERAFAEWCVRELGMRQPE